MSGFIAAPVQPGYFPQATGNDQIVGSNAGLGQTGARVFLAGLNAGKYTTQSDLIVVGDGAFSVGTSGSKNNDANAAGTIAIGTSALAVASNFSATLAGSAIAIGYQAGASLLGASGDVLIGAQTLANAVGSAAVQDSGNVVIGYQAGQNAQPNAAGGNSFQASIAIGYQCAQMGGAPGNHGMLNSVVIGSQALQNSAGIQVNSAVIIGFRACRGYGTSTNGNIVVIGAAAGASLVSGQDDVFIGSGADGGGATTQCVIIGSTSRNLGANNDTLVGYAVTIGTGGGNTMLGANVRSQAGGNPARCILIGWGSGDSMPGNGTDFCILETFDGATRRNCLYADMAAGNVILGKSTPAVNRDLNGTNTLKLLNGTIGGANPVGGGYFYVNAGALHWVGSAGTDTPLAAA